MSTTTGSSVDVGAIAGNLQAEVADRLAETIVLTIDRLRDEERPLNQLQEIALVHTALRSFDGFERAAARCVVDDLTRNGVETWGLSTELSDLLPGDDE
jgi:hypothetical protein